MFNLCLLIMVRFVNKFWLSRKWLLICVMFCFSFLIFIIDMKVV